MKNFKPVWLLPIVAATLVACGGGEGLDEPALGKESSQGEYAAIEIPDEAKPTSSWVLLNDESTATLGNRSQLKSGLSSLIPEKAASASQSSAADGLLIKIETAPDGWQVRAREALKAGQVVVIESSGKGDASLQVKKASLELTGLGVAAAAVMLYQGEAESDSYAVLPFEANEMKELSALMIRVGKRSATPQVTAAAAQ